ncbi:MAG: winged helix-turn-helix transcriptional regulator [Candidatus Taylorbacteria bacterium]|nr:winged helix-turn-helix transcriptional regulator [Candidatus Taylorbacteria bacterium]
MEKKIERKNYRTLERLVRGFANHRRIQIMEVLQKEPEMSVDEITELLNINYKTAADHLRRLAIAGLVLKKSDSVSIRHRLTPRAEYVLKFLRTLE